MASLQQRNGSYRVIFRYRGRQHFVTIGKVSRREAEAKSAQADYLLLRLDQRLIELPPGTDIVDFVRHDGKPPAPSGGGLANMQIQAFLTAAVINLKRLAEAVLVALFAALAAAAPIDTGHRHTAQVA